MTPFQRTTLACAGALAATVIAGPMAAAAPTSSDDRAPVEEKTAAYPVIREGDCELAKAVITVRPDGTGTWRTTTFTHKTETGNVWRSTLDFRSATGAALFSRGPFASPEMTDGNPPPRVESSHQFTFERAQYASIDLTKTHLWSEC